MLSPAQAAVSGGDIIIHTLQWGPVRIYNTTLTCLLAGGTAGSAEAAPPVTLVAESVQQLLWGMQVLGQLQPFTIMLARDMSVPSSTWPKVGRFYTITSIFRPYMKPFVLCSVLVKSECTVMCTFVCACVLVTCTDLY